MSRLTFKRIKRSWELLKNRQSLRGATVYDSTLAHTTGGTVWSKAFISGMADVYPARTSSYYRHLIVTMDHYEKEIQKSQKQVTAVYIVGSQVREFVETIFPKITKKIAIVTGNAIESVPSAALGSSDSARRFLDDERLVGAWIQNLDIQHPKAFPLPLGLDFHNLHINTHGPWHDNAQIQTPNEQERQIQIIAGDALPFAQRQPEVFSHFTVETQPVVRSEWLEYFRGQSFAQTPTGSIERSALWRNMASAQFVASPPGAGMDCHRTWEALVLGSVPIIQRFPHMAAMFEDLPVWQVESVSEVTPENLREKADEVSRKLQENQYNFRKLTVGWWKEHLVRQTTH